MSRSKLGPDKHAEVRAEFQRQGGTLGQRPTERGVILNTARACGVDRGTVYSLCCPHRPAEVGPVPSQPTVFKDDGATGQIDYHTYKPITSLEDAVAHGNVDLSTWFVKSWQKSTWEVALKVGVKGAETVETRTLTRVWLNLHRLLPKPEHEAYKALVADLTAQAPKYRPPVVAIGRTPCMLEIDLFDTHFGKLAWGKETGQDYDLATTERIFRDAVLDLLDEADGKVFDRVVFPIGNDFLQVDTPGNQTANGTVVDTDGRLGKILKVGRKSLVWAIDELQKRVGQIHVIEVEGNHDRRSAHILADWLQAWYRSAPNVLVEPSDRPRRYITHGVNLIGYTHGDEEKHLLLPGIMSTEAEDLGLWSGKECREWHLGHFHKAKRIEFMPLDTINGVAIRFLHSLSAVDSWHFRKGYVGGRRAAEAFVWHPTRGLTNNLFASVRPGVLAA